MTEIRQDVDAVIDYQVDWTAWLGEETITASTFTVDSGITKGSTSFDDTTATVRLSGGTLTHRYQITNHITSSDGQQEDHTFTIIVVQR